MLTELSIRNIVLIESCDISLGKGLCVLSGETGAGKSILLDSLGLVLGARADSSLLRHGEQQGTVSAEFDISDNQNAQDILQELGIAHEDAVIIRRSIAADGKTRCYLNDQPSTVAALKRLGEVLVEVHGQHDQRSLMDMTLHRAMLDEYAGLNTQQKIVSKSYHAWKSAFAALELLKQRIEQAAKEQDYLRHMRNELSQLAPQSGEEEALANQRTVMMQSEKLFELLREVNTELSGGKGVSTVLRSAQRLLSRSTLSVSPQFTVVADGLEKAAIEVDEAIAHLEKIGEDAQFDPQKLERIEDRLFALKAAARKYNMPVDELASLCREVEEKLALMESQGSELAKCEQEVKSAQQAFIRDAEKLSEGRKKAASKLQKAVEAELKPLKMENTRFQIRLEPLMESAWSEFGMDGVHFECATNISKGAKEVPYAPLSKIASGGELSRFMLALKVALSSVREAGTLIFDEIDAGTGGAVADAIGQRLSKLGSHAQVLVVTHLPQVAARGNQHLLVEKQQGKKIVTQVTALTDKARQEELARMLAGSVITPEARKAAAKLLEQAA